MNYFLAEVTIASTGIILVEAENKKEASKKAEDYIGKTSLPKWHEYGTLRVDRVLKVKEEDVSIKKEEYKEVFIS